MVVREALAPERTAACLSVWGYIGIGVAVGVALTVTVRWARAVVAARAARVREPGHHRRTQCAGCGEWIIRARCWDGRNRFFDDDPVAIERPGEPEFMTGDVAHQLAARRITVRNARWANQQLWVFDPNEHMAMVRFGNSFHIREGLRLHFCTLRQLHDPQPFDRGDKVRWAPHMTLGDFVDEP